MDRTRARLTTKPNPEGEFSEEPNGGLGCLVSPTALDEKASLRNRLGGVDPRWSGPRSHRSLTIRMNMLEADNSGQRAAACRRQRMRPAMVNPSARCHAWSG